VRLISWNIRAGGGTRAGAIAAQLQRWQPDIAGLCECRATPPSRGIAQALAEMGLNHQLTTADPAFPGRNALLLASRWPLRRRSLRRAPLEPGRWLLADVATPLPFLLAVMHFPNMATGRKVGYMEAVTRLTTGWRHGPAVFLGDTNCGWPGIDEENPVFHAATGAWLDDLEARGWPDAYRHLHGREARVYTWYSPNAGNGFRLDQAFVNRRLIGSLASVQYEWGADPGNPARRDALSDHAALILDFADQPAPALVANSTASAEDDPHDL